MGDFDWKIWWGKLGKGIALVAGASVALYGAEYISVNPVPPEYALWGGLAIIILQQIGNYIKHEYLEPEPTS